MSKDAAADPWEGEHSGGEEALSGCKGPETIACLEVRGGWEGNAARAEELGGNGRSAGFGFIQVKGTQFASHCNVKIVM